MKTECTVELVMLVGLGVVSSTRFACAAAPTAVDLDQQRHPGMILTMIADGSLD